MSYKSKPKQTTLGFIFLLAFCFTVSFPLLFLLFPLRPRETTWRRCWSRRLRRGLTSCLSSRGWQLRTSCWKAPWNVKKSPCPPSRRSWETCAQRSGIERRRELVPTRCCRKTRGWRTSWRRRNGCSEASTARGKTWWLKHRRWGRSSTGRERSQTSWGES